MKMELSRISWPVFKLKNHKPTIAGGLVFYSSEYVNESSGELRTSTRIVDDTSIAADTLGMRRLRLAVLDGVKLFPIRTAIYFLQDLVKAATSTTWFIDSAGEVFQYKKSASAKLTFHKIKQVLPLAGMGCAIEVEGVSQRFKCLYHPTSAQQYAGVLHWGMAPMLYGFYEQYHRPTHRKV